MSQLCFNLLLINSIFLRFDYVNIFIYVCIIYDILFHVFCVFIINIMFFRLLLLLFTVIFQVNILTKVFIYSLELHKKM